MKSAVLGSPSINQGTLLASCQQIHPYRIMLLCVHLLPPSPQGDFGRFRDLCERHFNEEEEVTLPQLRHHFCPAEVQPVAKKISKMFTLLDMGEPSLLNYKTNARRIVSARSPQDLWDLAQSALSRPGCILEGQGYLRGAPCLPGPLPVGAGLARAYGNSPATSISCALALATGYAT
jgi:hypothetical protein